MLADTEGLQETLYKEMRGRIQEADQSAPVRRGHPFAPFTRHPSTVADQSMPRSPRWLQWWMVRLPRSCHRAPSDPPRNALPRAPPQCNGTHRFGRFFYYTRTLEGQQYAVHCRRALSACAAPPTEADAMDESVPGARGCSISGAG